MSDSGVKKVYKQVDFDLPFVLFVRDSMRDEELDKWYAALQAGEKNLPYAKYAPPSGKPDTVVVGGHLPVYIPPAELAPPYDIALPEMTVGLFTLKRVNVHKALVPLGELPGDRTGRTSFSSVKVVFRLADIPAKFHEEMMPFCYQAVRAVNHFIAHYRVIADRPWVGPVTPALVQEFALTTISSDGARLSQLYHSGGGPLNGFGGSVSDEQDTALRTAIASPLLPTVFNTLDLNVRDCLDLQDWRLAVIESAVMFEAWLHGFLRDRLKAQKRTERAIEQFFLKNDGNPRSVTSLAKSGIRDVVRFDFGSTAEYQNWGTNVRDPRNDLIHGTKFTCTEAEAQRAYADVKAAISLIRARAT